MASLYLPNLLIRKEFHHQSRQSYLGQGDCLLVVALVRFALVYFDTGCSAEQVHYEQVRSGFLGNHQFDHLAFAYRWIQFR